MAKADDVNTLSYAANGSKWFLVRHLHFETEPGVEVRSSFSGNMGFERDYLPQNPGKNSKLKI
ncbi:MAG: hypothetical protein ABI760_03170 [Ferruginibacter sp.]